MSQYILEMKDICKSFNGVQVLTKAKLQLRPGEVHVLLGENGAGKSTLIKILSGAYTKDGGNIYLEGNSFENKTPKQAIEEGVSVIYQEFNLNPHVSIYENIYLGKEFKKGCFLDTKKAIQEAKKYMSLIGLTIDPRTLVSQLSVSQKQMVEIAKAISCDVKVLVLDEPTAAITDKETEKLFSIVRNLKAKGIGIIYISHRMNELFEIGDRCTVMRDGEYVNTVELRKTNVQELTKMMVGRDVCFNRIENFHVKDEVVLKVKELCYKNLLFNINLELRKGEILGVAGLVGAGRTELAKCIIGAYKKDSGLVEVGGKTLKGNCICESIDNGIVYLSEDRKDEGLVLSHSVTENIALPNLKLFGKLFLNKKEINSTAENYIQKLRIKTSSRLQKAQNLSGGNQQKVVIAKWLHQKADIYIFDEPTRGIDVGARDEIYNIMYNLIKEGASIIMISSDLVEVMKMCDRIAVMKEGELAQVLQNTDVLTQEEILSYALHGGEANEQIN